MENVYLAIVIMCGLVGITTAICIAVCIYRRMEIKHNNGERRPPPPMSYDDML